MIGAGVVGLAVARCLARRGLEVAVVERNSGIGRETSSRNSEVVHAGIHYRPGSRKARFCRSGAEMLRTYCAERHIACDPVGKLIVAATEDEAGALQRLWQNGSANGVPGLHWLSGGEARRLEPALRCHAALLSDFSAVVDSHALMLQLEHEARSAGAEFVFRSPVLAGALADRDVVLEIGGAEPSRLRCRYVVNCAGLGATAVSRSIAGVRSGTIPRVRLCKGSYFHVRGRPPFSRLVYPLPGGDSIGLHYLVDRDGRVRLGPDVEWVDTIDYDVDPARAGIFAASAKRYWPGLADDALYPGYSGIRAKIDAPESDFAIFGPSDHGGSGYVALYGIDSPGLTSALMLGRHVSSLLGVLGRP